MSVADGSPGATGRKGFTYWGLPRPKSTTEVDLRGGHIELDGFPALRERGTAPPLFRPLSIVATVAHLSYC